ncbi:MAG: alpha/beta fold hydrolase [Polyangiales bacterium]
MWMLLHGFMGSERSWDSLITMGRFDDTPRRPRLLGHGDDWRSRRVSTFEEEVARLVDEAGSMPSPRFLCGYSMGARVALGALAAGGVDFAGAVLVGVHPGLETRAERAERRQVDAARIGQIREEGLGAFVDAWESDPLFASQQGLAGAKLSVQRDVRVGHDPAGLVTSLEVLGLAEMPSYADTLRSHSNLLLVAGALDDKFVSIARRAGTPRAPVFVEGAGHNVVLEAPGAIVETMEAVECNHARD